MQGKINDRLSFLVPNMAREVSIVSIRELGDTVRRVRKESGLTQRDAAALCNVSLPFLNGLEQGKATAQIGKVLGVCRRFGIEIKLTLPMAPGDFR
ncbi:MAG TPA: helix-turn-helix domain-containing protein [Rhodocyclaceae bacterium]|nr:helix-turn-helix domain-containing protein [Rhodocyclaceae bacterium]